MRATKTVPPIIKYTNGILKSYYPIFLNTKIDAVNLLIKKKPVYILNTLKSFEQISVSLDNVKETINGKVVARMRTNSMLKIKAYNNAIDFLINCSHSSLDLLL